MWSDKGKRSWLASFVFLTLIVGLIFFLTLMEIPSKNKDLITSIIGMIVGSISTVISIFVGRDPDDVKVLKESVAELNGDRNALIERLRDAQLDKETLRKQLEGLQGQVIDRLSIFVGEHNLMALGGKDVRLSPEVERWMPKQQNTPYPSSSNPIPPGPPTPYPSGAPRVPSTEPPEVEPKLTTVNRPAPQQPPKVENEFDDWVRDFEKDDK
tara:strand:+ start:717 stop:1352 length:636 start_codon:yes stop_codon:yes gene_type:complete